MAVSDSLGIPVPWLQRPERARGAQAWREDRTLIAAADMIADALGQRFVESIPLNLEAAWAESRVSSPLICLLSPGGLCLLCRALLHMALTVSGLKLCRRHER